MHHRFKRDILRRRLERSKEVEMEMRDAVEAVGLPLMKFFSTSLQMIQEVDFKFLPLPAKILYWYAETEVSIQPLEFLENCYF